MEVVAGKVGKARRVDYSRERVAVDQGIVADAVEGVNCDVEVYH